jgi:hypothetical protein
MKRFLKIDKTTDGKFIGRVLEWDGVRIALNGFTFEAHEVADLGGGRWRFHNANYSADCTEVEV